MKLCHYYQYRKMNMIINFKLNDIRMLIVQIKKN